jgi:hypothetical protein
MSNKIHEYQVSDGRLFVFHCPGCGYDHPFHVGSVQHVAWDWNNSFDKPTFYPSLLIFKDDESKRCHSFVKEGMIQFLPDCFHSLKNQTIELPAWDDK